MNISVAYVDDETQYWQRLDVPEGISVKQAIETSGILSDHPSIDLTVQKVGIHGKITELDSTPKDGDRIEIYRPITADPTTVKRRKITAD